MECADAIEVADRVWVRAFRMSPRWPQTTAGSSAAVRAVLRDLLRLVAPAAGGAALGRSPAGAPYLMGWPGIGISLSHDGPWMVAAVAAGRSVGVDAQAPVVGSARRLARRCLGAGAARLAGLPPAAADEEVAWVWSVQEACAKVAGRGLECRPWTFPVAPVCPAGALPGVRWRQLRGSAGLPLSCAWSA